MLTTNYAQAVLTAALFSLPLVRSQFVSSLPQCVQTCINQSQDDNCDVTDVACLCRASNGNFLPDLITCMHGNCDNSLDNDLLLTPLQLACDLAGVPISSAAISNAESEASSLATQVTTTVYESGSPSATVTTITFVETDVQGSTATLAYPVTVGSSTTIYGQPSTVTTTASEFGSTSNSDSSASTSLTSMSGTGSGFTGVVPIIILTTNSAGSTYTTTTSELGAISTFTTTDSAGSTTTLMSTYTETTTASASVETITSTETLTTTNSVGSTFTTTTTAVSTTTVSESSSVSGVGDAGSSSGGGGSASSTVTETTSVAAQATTGATTSHTSSSKKPENTNGSPFSMQSSANRREKVGSFLGVSVLLVVGVIWF